MSYLSNKKFKTIVASILGLSLLGGTISFNFGKSQAVQADGDKPTIYLGDFTDLDEGYIAEGSFSNATGSDSGAYTYFEIYLTNNRNVSPNPGYSDITTLPDVAGYDSQNSTDYVTRVEINTPKTAKQIAEEYIRNIEYKVCNEQTIRVELMDTKPDFDVVFDFSTNHYFTFVDEAKTWTEAYEAAKGMTYQGRQGYLATFTNEEEEKVVFKGNNEKTGWLGGTTIKNPNNQEGLYYSYGDLPYDSVDDLPATTSTSKEVSSYLQGHENYWYWACGPEIGNTFFAPNKVISNPDEAWGDYVSTTNSSYYFDWRYTSDPQPDNSRDGQDCLANYYEPDHGEAIYGWSVYTEGFDNYYWGDDYHCEKKGFYVEFGDLTYGDTHPYSNVYSYGFIGCHGHNDMKFEQVDPWGNMPTDKYAIYLPDNYFYETIETPLFDIVNTTVNLCLNGCTFSRYVQVGTLMRVGPGGTLNIYDCNPNTENTVYEDSNGLWHSEYKDGYTEKTVNGGLIYGGNCSQGGAIQVEGGTLNLYGGTIAGNIAMDDGNGKGGALYVSDGGTVNMYGGCISANSADWGDGVYVEDGCHFNMYGGEISNSLGVQETGVYSFSNVTLGGTAKIKGNSVNNLYLNGGAKVVLGENDLEPTTGMDVGVSLSTNSGRFVENSSNGTSGSFFSSDTQELSVRVADTEADPNKYDYYLTTTHNVSVSPTGNGQIEVNTETAFVGETVTITVNPGNLHYLVSGSVKATYTNAGINELSINEVNSTTYTFRMPDFPVTVSAEFLEKGNVSISETPQTFTYDGNPHSFVINGTSLDGFTVKYKVGGNWVNDAPVNAGSYDVQVERNEDATNKSFSTTISGGIVINKAKVDEPSVVGTYTENGNPITVQLDGFEEFMSTSSSLTESNPGIYTINITLDGNHEWDEGSDGIITWEIKSIKKEGVDGTVEIEGGGEGFGGDVTVVVEVSVEETVRGNVAETLNNFDDESINLGKNEEVGLVFNVKLIQTDSNGEEKEIQPGDIAPGTTIIIKMKLPNDLDIDKVTKLLHIHSVTDIELLEFDPSNIDADGYYIIRTNKLSQFAFVYNVESPCWAHWVLIALLVVGIALYLVCYLVFKNKFLSLLVCLADLLLTIFFACFGKCVICIIFTIVDILAIIFGVIFLFYMDKDNELKEKLTELKEEAINKKDEIIVSISLSGFMQNDPDKASLKDSMNLLTTDGLKGKFSKDIVVKHLREKYHDQVKLICRPNATKPGKGKTEGLPLADTHYVTTGEGKSKCFIYVYEVKGSVLLLVNMPKEKGEELMKTHHLVKQSAFPKAKDSWFSIIVDQTWDEDSLLSLIDETVAFHQEAKKDTK